uniref:Cnd3 domain-containing protein n=1 Tax=Rhabditophanes sp. KR3021 TaxID=114890 RepID=A0AC35TQ82_9BILA
MAMHLSEVEAFFVQKLADADEAKRHKAFKVLQKWMKEQSKSTGLDSDSLNRLCKGIHAMMWMQAKPIPQEDLAEQIVLIHTKLESEQEKVDFFYQMLLVINNELMKTDKHRLDKFLMVVRRLFRQIFKIVQESGWSEEMSNQYLELLDQRIFHSTDKKFTETMLGHLISVYMDEFDKAVREGILPEKDLGKWFEVFFKLLKKPKTSDYLFDLTVKDIFEGIIIVLEAGVNKDDDENEVQAFGLYQAGVKVITAALFEIAKSPTFKHKRRTALYELCEKLELAAKKGVEVTV